MAFTTTGQVTVDQTAYNLATDYALRPELYFDAFADVKPTAQSFPGASVIFNITSDLAAVTTALDESTDVTPVAMGDSQITVNIAEYGNAVKTTAKLRGVSYVVPYDAVVANVLGFNAGLSLDTIVRNTVQAGANVRYASGGTNTATARNQIIPGNVLVGNDVRRALADLRGANVPTFGGYYAAMVHPDVSYDLRGGTGAANWRDPHTYGNDATGIWNGEVGVFEGFRFVESPRAPLFADAGSSTTLTDVYGTLFFGAQAIAKAYSYTDGNGPMPRIVPGPVTDTLRRFVPLGWYFFGGYGTYRDASLRRVESASSIGTNS